MAYWAYELCGRLTPAAANAYITRPEQSNPDGLAPPQRYGTPRDCIAIPTARAPTLEGGGAAIGDVFTGEELLDDDPPLGAAGSVGAIACAAAVCCCCASLASAWRRSSACRAASAARICVICPGIDESSARRWASCCAIDARSAARWRTICACCAF